MPERIQKYLARLGVGSRRQIEDWIRAGRFRVNGKQAELGHPVEPSDSIELDGQRLRLYDAAESVPEILVYHKPAGLICTRQDPEGRATVYADLPRCRHGRWVAVGRLDIATSGLLLFTNNGELAHRLMHPAYQVAREYAVRVLGQVSEQALARATQGVMLDDGLAKFDSITDAGGSGANHWFHVVLQEGRNREVRRIWEALGYTVSRLHRVRFGLIALPRRIRPGRFESLPPENVAELMASVGLSMESMAVSEPSHSKRKPIKRSGLARKRPVRGRR